MYDEVHIGWLGCDDYVRRRAADAARDTDQPDEVTPRRDLLGELLTGRYEDDEPPGAPR